MRPPVRWIRRRAHQHLGDADREARRRPARSQDAERRRKQADDAAENDRRPDVDVRSADGARPRERRDPQREQDAGDPLETEEAGKQPVRPLMEIGLVLFEELGGAASGRNGLRHRLTLPELLSCPTQTAGSRTRWYRACVSPAVQQREQRLPSGVIALMRAGAGDPAAELQAAVLVVQQRLSRRRRPRTPALQCRRRLERPTRRAAASRSARVPSVPIPRQRSRVSRRPRRSSDERRCARATLPVRQGSRASTCTAGARA